MTYIVRYIAVDGFNMWRKFKHLESARRFAQKYVGKAPTLGQSYAVSDDGVGTVRVVGCTLKELFPESE